MGKRVAAILVIFLCSTLAWVVLGGTIMTRTYSLDGSLQQKVASTWGSPQTQSPPAASFVVTSYKEAESLEDGKKVVRKVEVKEEKRLALDASRVDVQLDLEPRKKGLLWYSTYKVVFDAKYTFATTLMAAPEEITIRLPFPAAQALYDDLAVKVDGVPIAVTSEPASAPSPGVTSVAAVRGKTMALPGMPLVVDVRYRSQGLDTWRYDFGGGATQSVAQVRDFELKMATNFDDTVIVDGKPIRFAAAAFAALEGLKQQYYKAHNVPEETQAEWEGRTRRPVPQWKPSMRSTLAEADKFPDTKGGRVYPAKPLAGIWSTAPYLNNGSVANMWDLLTPPASRPASFLLGSREYDVQKLGYITTQDPKSPAPPWEMKTSLTGNSNAGHVYGTHLPDEDKWALIEYLKKLRPGDIKKEPLHKTS